MIAILVFSDHYTGHKKIHLNKTQNYNIALLKDAILFSKYVNIRLLLSREEINMKCKCVMFLCKLG